MKKIFKRIVAIVLATGISNIFTSLNAFAVNDIRAGYNYELNYIEDVLPKYLVNNDIELDDIYISDSFNVFNAELDETCTADTYVVFEEDDIIGLLTVDERNGKYFSSFEHGDFSELQNLYDSCADIAFVSYKEGLYVENNSKNISIANRNSNTDFRVSGVEHYPIIKRTPITPSRDGDGYYYRNNLSVPIVSNAGDPYNGYGLCWAASISAKYNYLTNSNWTALGLFYALESTYGGHPSGTDEWVQTAFAFFGMDDTQLKRMLNCIEICTQIDAYNPIYIEMSDYTDAHAMVLCGITFLTDGNGIYRLMDPNRTVLVDVNVTADVMDRTDPFCYATTYGYTFTNWYESWF